MNVVNMFTPITKWTTSLRDESTIPEVIRKAFKLAVAEKPGATHVELPEDIAKHEIEGAAPIVPPEKVRRPVPDEKSIAGRPRPHRPRRAPRAARRPGLRAHPREPPAAALRRVDRHLRRHDLHGQGRAVRPPRAQPLRRRPGLARLRHRGVRGRRPRHRRRLRHGRVAARPLEHRAHQAAAAHRLRPRRGRRRLPARPSRSSATSPPRSGPSTRASPRSTTTPTSTCTAGSAGRSPRRSPRRGRAPSPRPATSR